MKTWTSASGKSVEAAYVKMADGVVYLMGEDGKERRIPFSSLNEESKLAVKALEKAKPSSARSGPQPTGDALVDQYTREIGTVLGTYDHRLFRVHFYEQRGQMDLFLKEEGGVVKSPPIRSWLHVYYKGSSGDLDQHRPPYRYTLSPGQRPGDIVGMGIAGARSSDHVYV